MLQTKKMTAVGVVLALSLGSAIARADEIVTFAYAGDASKGAANSLQFIDPSNNTSYWETYSGTLTLDLTTQTVSLSSSIVTVPYGSINYSDSSTVGNNTLTATLTINGGELDYEVLNPGYSQGHYYDTTVKIFDSGITAGTLPTLTALDSGPVAALVYFDNADDACCNHYPDGTAPAFLSVVPEPASMTVLALGVASLVGVRRRRD